MKCPWCKAEIDHLVEWCPEYVPYVFRVHDDGEVEEEPHDLEPDCIDMLNNYCCPSCGQCLTTKRESAIALLKGEVKS